MSNRKPKDPEKPLIEAGQLLDAYGALLTRRQREFVHLHFEEDLSFSAIARDFKITRQAVHDSVKHAVASLRNFESALGLAAGTGNEGRTPDVRISGQQLIGRLENLSARLRNGQTADAAEVTDELDTLVGLLRGERAE